MGSWQQCVYLLKRNWWIKKRNKRQSIQEILFPIYMVGILAMIRALVKTDPLPSISDFPCQEVFPNASVANLTNVTIGVSPPDQHFLELVQNASRLFNHDPFNFSLIQNSSEMEKLYKNGQISVGIEFNSSTAYTLRFPAEQLADTDDLTVSQSLCRDHNTSIGKYSKYSTPYQCPGLSYVTSGFASLQAALDAAIIEHSSGRPANYRVNSCLFPTLEYQPSVQYLQAMISIYLVMAFSPIVNFLLVNLVTEKEKKIKVGMKMMGLSDTAFWLSWFITYSIITLATVIIVTIISFFALFRHSNFFLIFIMFLGYGLSVISFSFMLTPFFEKATSAGGLGSFATIIFSILVIPAIYADVPLPWKWVLSLLSPAAFGFGITEMIVLDSYFGGANFNQFVSSSYSADSFSIGASFLMLVIDTVLYWFLAFYFDNIVPGEFGQAKPFYFCLTPRYWRKQDMKLTEEVRLTEHVSAEDHVPVERVPPELASKAAIRIRGLRKEFIKEKQGCCRGGNELVTAVSGLNLTVYEGQITALLGHNGAGKSTLIACLTGLTPCTSGGAQVYDLDINNASDMDRIRKTTGICPQHDILFDFLTTREHLVIFAGIKGVPKERTEEEVERALEEVNLTKHKDTIATKLSGGQKRKLSVAIALIGDPTIMFLDEPTSGMDPYSRRQLWSLLQSKREGRVIFLTTHFMDEADILADRKAVLSKGKLQCAGSSLFLKSRFGLGYHLGMVIEQGSNVGAISALVKDGISGALLDRSHGQEISYTLPLQDVSSFPELFTRLESESSKLGIQSYGVSMTTLEEVFLQLEELEAVEEKDKENGENLIKESQKADYGSLEEPSSPNAMEDTQENEQEGNTLASFSVVQESALNWQQFKAMLYVRFLVMLRSPLAVIFRLFFPPLLIILAIVIARSINSDIGQPSMLPLNASMYLSNVSQTNPNCAPLHLKPPFLLNNDSRSSDLLEGLTDQSVGFCFPGVNFSDIDKFLLDNQRHALALQVSGSALENYKTFYNSTLAHSLPVGINVLNNALYRNATQSSEDFLSVASFPFQFKNPRLPFDTSSYVVILIIGIGFLLIPSGFAIDVVLDREVRARHQLHVSGLRRHVYWLSALTAHLTTYLIPVILMLILIPALDLKVLEPPPAIGLTIITLFLSLPVQTIYVYIWSFLFNKSETVQGVMPSVISLLGLIPYITVSIAYHHSPDAIAALNYVFMVLIPPYTTLGSLWFISVVYQNHLLDPANNDLSASTYFSFSSHISPAIFILIFDIVVLSLILYWLDKRSIGDQGYCSSRSARHKEDIESSLLQSAEDDLGDDDVKKEQELVVNHLRSSSGGAPVMIGGLRKEFPKESTSFQCCQPKKEKKVKVAVKNLYLKVEKGEILGLLGPNGAGKTTSLNVFTGDLTPTRGAAYLNGKELGNDVGEAALSLGYCPQLDALWPLVTLNEHLRLYALIKGVAPKDVDSVVRKFCRTMKIMEHLDKRAKALSGGTKRKLSFLVSMVGNPAVLLMDEPSTGMDPSSKRFLWNIISDVVAGSKAAILTTHSMEEADALCSRIGIMVAGALRCVGSTQHLKSKYGSGYQLEIKIAPSLTESGCHLQDSLSVSSRKRSPIERQTSTGAREVGLEHGSEALSTLMDRVKKLFPGAVQIECFGDRATYSVPREAVPSLAKAFLDLEQTKVEFGVEEYSFSQSTLEQIFINFAKQQFDDED